MSNLAELMAQGIINDLAGPLGHKGVEFQSEAESLGRTARLDGFSMAHNPYSPTLDNWLHRSWNAGWFYVDLDQNAPKAKIRY